MRSNSAMRSDDQGQSKEETRERVIYALMAAAVGLGREFRVPLKRMSQLWQMRYFHELRSSGFSVSEIAERLVVSASTAAALARTLKRNFLAEDNSHTLPRRIEFLIWPEPLGAGRIRQSFSEHPPAAVDAALERLVESGRVEIEPGQTRKYRVAAQASRMIGPELSRRIDALESLQGNVRNAVLARFFRSDDRATARTVSLRVHPSAIARLDAFYQETVWPMLAGLEEEVLADGEADSIELDFSILWAPRPDDTEAEE